MWTDATRAQYARADLAFGREVRAAQAQRRKRLVSEQLAEERDGRTVYRRNMLAALQRRELLRVARRLSDEVGKPFVEMKMKEPIQGRLARAVDMTSGRTTLVERSEERRGGKEGVSTGRSGGSPYN